MVTFDQLAGFIAVAEELQLYLEHGLDARDDSIGMQYYIDGWSFDSKRPCLVR
jgi:glucarate dehydratase